MVLLLRFLHIIILRPLLLWKFILFTSLPTQAASSLSVGTQTLAQRISEVFWMDTCKFCFFFPQRFYIGARCDTYFEWFVNAPADVHIFISCHSNYFRNPVLWYGFLFSLLIDFSSFSCLCNADACWICDLDPTYFLTVFHWFILIQYWCGLCHDHLWP